MADLDDPRARLRRRSRRWRDHPQQRNAVSNALRGPEHTNDSRPALITFVAGYRCRQQRDAAPVQHRTHRRAATIPTSIRRSASASPKLHRAAGRAHDHGLHVLPGRHHHEHDVARGKLVNVRRPSRPSPRAARPRRGAIPTVMSAPARKAFRHRVSHAADADPADLRGESSFVVIAFTRAQGSSRCADQPPSPPGVGWRSAVPGGIERGWIERGGPLGVKITSPSMRAAEMLSVAGQHVATANTIPALQFDGPFSEFGSRDLGDARAGRGRARGRR